MMISLHIKPGQYVTIGGTVLQITEDRDYELYLSVDAPEGVSVKRGKRRGAGKTPEIGETDSFDELRTRFGELTKRLAGAMPAADTPEWKEITGELLSELTFALADQANRQKRKARQAEGIAAARERGVRFGRKQKHLPKNFSAIRQAWRNGEISTREAAEECGMTQSIFRDTVRHTEEREAAETGVGVRESEPAQRGPVASGSQADVSGVVCSAS